MAKKEYDPKENWKERSSTSVVVIILTIVSIVLFTVGASMLFSWLSNKEMDERLNSDAVKVVVAVREHYNLPATDNDKSMKIKTDGDKSYYIVVASDRIFRVESYDENDYHVYNVEEVGNENENSI